MADFNDGKSVLNTQTQESSATSGFATKADIKSLKSQMNGSMTEMIEMLVGMQETVEAFEERIQKFNRVSPYKL